MYSGEKMFMNNFNLSYLFKFCRSRALFELVYQRAHALLKNDDDFSVVFKEDRP